jgi:hypothetical protein
MSTIGGRNSITRWENHNIGQGRALSPSEIGSSPLRDRLDLSVCAKDSIFVRQELDPPFVIHINKSIALTVRACVCVQSCEAV